MISGRKKKNKTPITISGKTGRRQKKRNNHHTQDRQEGQRTPRNKREYNSHHVQEYNQCHEDSNTDEEKVSLITLINQLYETISAYVDGTYDLNTTIEEAERLNTVIEEMIDMDKKGEGDVDKKGGGKGDVSEKGEDDTTYLSDVRYTRMFSNRMMILSSLRLRLWLTLSSSLVQERVTIEDGILTEEEFLMRDEEHTQDDNESRIPLFFIREVEWYNSKFKASGVGRRI